MPAKNPITISSPQNPKVKSLVRLGDRRERDEKQCFLVEGIREISRALDGDYVLKEILSAESLLTNEGRSFFSEYAGSIKNAEHTLISNEVFEKIAVRSGSDGILAVFAYKAMTLSALALGKEPFLLLTEDVEKPGNLGAILRTANGAGVDAVLVLSRGVDPYNPNAIRASLGAVFATPVVLCSNEEALRFCQERGIQVVVASPEATKDFSEIVATKGVGILVGSEADGVSAFWKENADTHVAIPMAGKVDSLNVSVAAGIMMYEVRRQRGHKSRRT